MRESDSHLKLGKLAFYHLTKAALFSENSNPFKGYYDENFMTERKLLWEMYSLPNPERHYWNILLINEPREIKIIQQKLYEALAPVISRTDIDKGKIGMEKLHYELFRLESTVSEIDFSEVYQGKVKRDRRLFIREDPDGWLNFVDQIYNGRV